MELLVGKKREEIPDQDTYDFLTEREKKEETKRAKENWTDC